MFEEGQTSRLWPQGATEGLMHLASTWLWKGSGSQEATIVWMFSGPLDARMCCLGLSIPMWPGKLGSVAFDLAPSSQFYNSSKINKAATEKKKKNQKGPEPQLITAKWLGSGVLAR